MSCQDGRNNCAERTSSSCISYEGSLLKTIDITTLPCTANINDIFEVLDTDVDALKSDVDITGLDKLDLIIDVTTAKQKDLNQLLVNEVSALKAKVATLEYNLLHLNILGQQLTIDLNALFGNVQCSPTNTYTIGFIITSLVNEINNLKTQINK